MKFILAVSFVLLLSSSLLTSFGLKLTIFSLNITNPSTSFGRITSVHWFGTDGMIYFNSTVDIYQELGKQKAIIQVFIPTSDADESYKRLYFQSTADMCKITSGGKSSNYFMRAFLDGYLKVTKNFPYCTTPKGSYTSSNFTFDYNMMVPMRDEIKFRLILKYHALKRDNKTWTPLFFFNVKGKLENQMNLTNVLRAIAPSF